MTAFPWRRTITVSPSKRNSLGRRTAWLLPVQKTLALLDFMIAINGRYHGSSGQANGSQHALMLTATVLIEAGDSAWVEAPGFLGARAALTNAGAKLVALP